MLPADYTFLAGDNGVHTFSATLKTASVQSLTATDTAAASIAGSQAGITVTPAAVSTFTVAGFPTLATPGVAAAFTVTARDTFGNIATGYLGKVHFTSSDSQAVVPADYTFLTGDNGVHAFTATLKTTGPQSLTATDATTASITGSQAGITVDSAGPTLTVNSTADNTTAGSFLTLREAIEVVDGTLGRALTAGEQAQINGVLGTNDIIQFNLPAGPQTITLTGGPLSITKPVTINGPAAANLTVSGNKVGRVFIVGVDYSQNLSLIVAISGLTISGGSAVATGKNYGGGLLNFGTLTVNNMTFTANSAGNSGGGAIYNDGALTITNSAFTGNSVTLRWTGWRHPERQSGTLTVTNCTFLRNTGTGERFGRRPLPTPARRRLAAALLPATRPIPTPAASTTVPRAT